MKLDLHIPAQAVYLRAFKQSDAQKVFLMSVESSMKKWIPDQVYDSVEHASEVLAFLISQYHAASSPHTVPVVLGICLAENDELIGHVGVSPLREDVEIGYAIEEKEHGHGYATLAVQAMCEWASERYSLPCILGIVAAENQASCRVLEKAGFNLKTEEMAQMHAQLRLVRRYEKQPVFGR
ncbi:MAG TPA: hypothetical protein DCG57_02995 [Candidatus Riflebacteria bacterium]|nr:hypothetical protein [Candidatus Riflebacteria bacterium]